MDSLLTWSNVLKWFQNYLSERIHCVKKFDGNSLLDNHSMLGGILLVKEILLGHCYF